MGTLAGPFVGAALLLALGGLFKARRPEPTARALRDVGLGALAPLARLLGVAEIAAGAVALAFTGPLPAAVVAAFYAGFAAFVLIRLARRGQPGASTAGCGCFGESEGPPTAIHVVLNVAAAAVAAAIAAGSGGGLSTALAGQPWAGVPLLALAAATTGLAYATLTILPRTLSELTTS